MASVFIGKSDGDILCPGNAEQVDMINKHIEELENELGLTVFNQKYIKNMINKNKQVLAEIEAHYGT